MACLTLWPVRRVAAEIASAAFLQPDSTLLQRPRHHLWCIAPYTAKHHLHRMPTHQRKDQVPLRIGLDRRSRTLFVSEVCIAPPNHLWHFLCRQTVNIPLRKDLIPHNRIAGGCAANGAHMFWPAYSCPHVRVSLPSLAPLTKTRVFLLANKLPTRLSVKVCKPLLSVGQRFYTEFHRVGSRGWSERRSARAPGRTGHPTECRG